MPALASISDIFEIMRGEHPNPHALLGLHEAKDGGKDVLVMRAFIPGAEDITLIDDKKGKSWALKKLHAEGFFESVIPKRKKWFKYRLLIKRGEDLWETYDPYSFLPVISELDRYLFGSGRHYFIYEKLGAHLKVLDGVSGVSFGVWAPGAKSVSVIGNFNDWDTRRSPMRALGDSGIWELFIPHLTEGDIYKYHVRTRDGKFLDKADPYGTWAELRPATASRVCDIKNFMWDDAAWLTNRRSGDKFNKPLNIYEAHLGSWKRGEDGSFLSYSELGEALADYAFEMGYTHIELLPVMEHPFDGSWGYQTTGYYAPTSRYGTPRDFMEFINSCHKKGIGVILDWVPAHFPKDAHGLSAFDGTHVYEYPDPKMGEHPDWGTLVFNFGRNEVKNFLIANALYWFREYHIDGLRVDAVASMLYLDYGKDFGEWTPNIFGGRENLEAVEFLKHLNSVVLGEFSDVFMIAEESTAWEGVTKPTEEGGLGFSFKWNMGWMNDYLKYLEKDCIYRKHHHTGLTFSIMYAYTERFILPLSHDEVVHLKGSMINKMPGDEWQKFANLRVAYGYMYTHPGKKLIFMGDEIAQFTEWNEDISINWDVLENYENRTLYEYIKNLNNFYLSEPALWAKDFDGWGFGWIECNDSERSIISFIRRGNKPEDDLIVVCNFTPEVYFDFRIGLPVAGEYFEALNSDASSFGGSGKINYLSRLSEPNPHNGQPFSCCIDIPPLGISVWKRA